MKGIFRMILAALMTVSLAACSSPDERRETASQGQEREETENTGTDSSVLIAYTREDPVSFAAEQIENVTGGVMWEIGDGEPENFETYETVLLGFVADSDQLPDSVQDFLTAYDFGAKSIIPFVINGEDSMEELTGAISQIQPGALIRNNGLGISEENIEEHAQEITEWARSLGLDQEGADTESSTGENSEIQTIAHGQVDAGTRQTFYLWEEGNMPSETEYRENNGGYVDDPDFRPTVRTFPVPEGTEVKGAVLICAGGAFQYRSDQYEGTPVAEALSQRGYQSFVVDYRLRPYTQEEGALDLARAVRFVRSHGEEYGIDEEDIAVMGFSAGGILSGEMPLNFDGTVNGTALDDSYVPDELDQVSADASPCGMIYAFYGRLSVASTDVEKFRESDLPPTYFAYGTRDPFVGEFEECIQALAEAGVPVESQVLEGMPHGFGAEGGWIDGYDQWLGSIFAEG